MSSTFFLTKQKNSLKMPITMYCFVTKDQNERQAWPAVPEPKWWWSNDSRPLGVHQSPEGSLNQENVAYLFLIFLF